MNDVQQDKASNGEFLRRKCNADGILRCCKLPRKYHHSEDDEILAFANQNDRLLLTFDRRIADEWASCFAKGCPGVLIVALDDESNEYITELRAIKILREFKQEFPQWSMATCRNSIVEIQPRYISVNHFELDSVRLTGFLDRQDDSWQTLQGLLMLNAARVY